MGVISSWGECECGECLSCLERVRGMAYRAHDIQKATEREGLSSNNKQEEEQKEQNEEN